MAQPTGALANFTPSDDCTRSFSLVYSGVEGGPVFAGPVATSGCFPENFELAPTAHYSPATECPRGYTSACQRVLTEGTVTETAVTCCPNPNEQTRWTCDDDASRTDIARVGCVSLWAEDMITFPSITQFSTIAPGDVAEFGPTRGPVSLGGPGAIHAYSIQIRHQQSDLQPTQTSGPLIPSFDPNSNSRTEPDDDSSLAPGAIAGIVVGVVLGLALFIGACYCGWRLAGKRASAGVYAPPPPLASQAVSKRVEESQSRWSQFDAEEVAEVSTQRGGLSRDLAGEDVRVERFSRQRGSQVG